MFKSSSARRTAATVVQDENDKNLYVINITFYYSYINMIYSYIYMLIYIISSVAKLFEADTEDENK